jgi:hypothetical protein
MKAGRNVVSSTLNLKAIKPTFRNMVIISVCALSLGLTGCQTHNADDFQDFTRLDPATLSKGDTIMPMRYIHSTTGDWKVEVRISADDLLDLNHKVASRKFTATDEKLLERIRRLKFLYGVGTIHKPSSTLRVYDHTQLFEQYGIVFEKDYLALQSKTFGIMTCVDEQEFYNIMKDMY